MRAWEARWASPQVPSRRTGESSSSRRSRRRAASSTERTRVTGKLSTSRRLRLSGSCRGASVLLVGRAGTGKTSVMGALIAVRRAHEGRDPPARADRQGAGPPCGKATNAEAMTVAQFLNRVGRYDGARQRPRFEGKEKYRKEKTIVIDECSMLTMDDAVRRPRGPRISCMSSGSSSSAIRTSSRRSAWGDPFADLVAFLETTNKKATEGRRWATRSAGSPWRSGRSAQTEPGLRRTRCDWRRGSRGSRSPSMPTACSATSSSVTKFNDLDIVLWKKTDELRAQLLDDIPAAPRVDGTEDVDGFDRALGLRREGLGARSTPPDGRSDGKSSRRFACTRTGFRT